MTRLQSHELQPGWFNWYVDRGRIPLPNRDNQREVDRLLRAKSYRRTL